MRFSFDATLDVLLVFLFLLFLYFSHLHISVDIFSVAAPFIRRRHYLLYAFMFIVFI